MATEIYVTYNPRDPYQIGESSAMRLQTIATLYDMKVNLPSRLFPAAQEISMETRHRIEKSKYLLVFNTGNDPQWMKAEVDYALLKSKPVVIVGAPDFQTEFYNNHKLVQWIKLEQYSIPNALEQIIHFLHQSFPSNQPKNKGEDIFGYSILAIGLGLLGRALYKNLQSA